MLCIQLNINLKTTWCWISTCYQRKGHRRLSRLVKQNWSHRMAQQATQYNTRPSRNVSADTVGYGPMQETTHSCASADQMSLPLSLCWTREHHIWTIDQWKRVAWLDKSWFVIHKNNGQDMHVPGKRLLPQCTVGQTQAGVVILCFGGCSLECLWNPWLW